MKPEVAISSRELSGGNILRRQQRFSRLFVTAMWRETGPCDVGVCNLRSHGKGLRVGRAMEGCANLTGAGNLWRHRRKSVEGIETGSSTRTAMSRYLKVVDRELEARIESALITVTST